MRQLEGKTLTTIDRKKPFRVVAVMDDSVRVIPEDGNGAKRKILRVRVEHIAALGLSKENCLDRIKQEYPDSQNKSYIASLALAVADASGCDCRKI